MLSLSTASLGQTAKIEIAFLKPPLIQERLERLPSKLRDRRAGLETLFQEAGCPADAMSEQPIPNDKQPNVICTLATDSPNAYVIVVGGHYDAVDAGTGAVDDWSGAALLPSLYESLKGRPLRHRFIFVGFAGEEVGLLGSREFVKKTPKDRLAAIHAMVNLECLGTSPPKVWAHRADKGLLSAYVSVAHSLNLLAVASNVELVGDDDSHPFLNVRVPVITIHSITQETYPILHSGRDSIKAIHPDDYYTAYRVIALYLAYLDTMVR